MIGNLPTGKGFYLWCILNCEQGLPEAIAAEADRLDISLVFFHIVDGWMNETQADRGAALEPYVAAMRRHNIACWGWGAIYPSNWDESVGIIANAVRRLGLDGFVIDGEGPMKGHPVEAMAFMGALRNLLPDLPIGLSSYRYPQAHPTFPFAEFIKKCDFVMPQVYYEQAHNPASQLRESLREYRNLTDLPFIPTFPLYHTSTWAPTLGDNLAAMQAAVDLGFQACNWWDWFQGHRDFPAIWEQVASFPFSQQEETLDISFIAQIPGQRVRTTPDTSTNTNIIGSLTTGQILTGLEAISVKGANDVWGKFKSVNGWAAIVNGGYIYLKQK